MLKSETSGWKESEAKIHCNVLRARQRNVNLRSGNLNSGYTSELPGYFKML